MLEHLREAVVPPSKEKVVEKVFKTIIIKFRQKLAYQWQMLCKYMKMNNNNFGVVRNGCC